MCEMEIDALALPIVAADDCFTPVSITTDENGCALLVGTLPHAVFGPMI